MKPDEFGLLRYYGCLQNYFSGYIAREHPLAKKIFESCHKKTLHWKIQTTMSKVREHYWIQKLRELVKDVHFKCHSCKKSWPKDLSSSELLPLPELTVHFSDSFARAGVDFAKPLYYKIKKRGKVKAYAALFTCAITRAVQQKLCKDLTTR